MTRNSIDPDYESYRAMSASPDVEPIDIGAHQTGRRRRSIEITICWPYVAAAIAVALIWLLSRQ